MNKSEIKIAIVRLGYAGLPLANGSKPVIADVKSIYNKDELIKLGFSVFRL